MKRATRTSLAVVFLAAFAALYLNGRSSIAQPQAGKPQACDSDLQLLSEFNDRIQERFKDVDNGFGYRRIIRPGDTPHRFSAENAKELKIVDDLKKAEVKVALYLAGRGALLANTVEMKLNPRFLIKGPGLVTVGDEQKQSLPAGPDLLEQGRKAMAAFETAQSYNFTLAGWNFTARPVRASDKSCLMCHNGDGASFFARSAEDKTPAVLKIGDVLGVVFYGYERAR